MTADDGRVQRLPRLVGEGTAPELAHTGRKVAPSHSRHQEMITYARDHSVADALNYIAT